MSDADWVPDWLARTHHIKTSALRDEIARLDRRRRRAIAEDEWDSLFWVGHALKSVLGDERVSVALSTAAWFDVNQ